MAEVIGTIASAMTLASLFKLCVEAFNVIRTSQNQALDLKKLTLKLNIEKCRLYTWGQAMGLTTTEQGRQKRPLDLCPYPELVHETMTLILDMLQDSQKLRGKYGCVSLDDQTARLAIQGPQTSVLQQLNASFDYFKIKSNPRSRPNSLLMKTCWVIHDRKKFEYLIHDAKSLIDSLQDITKDLQSQAIQQEIMTARIRKIDDVRTLDWLSEVCEENYPAFSDAASYKAETISVISTSYHHDQKMIDYDEYDSDASSVEFSITSLEDLTVTELKHKLSMIYLQANERLKLRKQAAEAPPTIKEPHRVGSSETMTSTTISDATSASGLAELEIDSKILEKMAEAAIDKEFQEELSAIMAWFDILNVAEKDVAFYSIGDRLSSDYNQTRFFEQIQSYRLEQLLKSLPAEKLEAACNTHSDSIEVNTPKPDQNSEKVTAPPIHTEQDQTRPNFAMKEDFEAHVRDEFKSFTQAEKNAINVALAIQNQERKMKEIAALKKFSQEFRLQSKSSRSSWS